jgi:hypothetical protein
MKLIRILYLLTLINALAPPHRGWNFMMDAQVLRPGNSPQTTNKDDFIGSARKAARLSIPEGTPQSFSSLGDLLDSLPSDASMRTLNIDASPALVRLPQEQRLVRFKALFYAAERSSSNDFNCVLGLETGVKRRFMMAVVSGLPQSGSQFFEPLTKPRNQFKDFFSRRKRGAPGKWIRPIQPADSRRSDWRDLL